MVPFNLELGMSSSTSSGASGSGGMMGDFVVSGGAQKQTITLYVVVGIIAVVLILMWFVWKGRK